MGATEQLACRIEIRPITNLNGVLSGKTRHIIFLLIHTVNTFTPINEVEVDVCIAQFGPQMELSIIL
jgi:hypothetical protein